MSINTSLNAAPVHNANAYHSNAINQNIPPTASASSSASSSGAGLPPPPPPSSYWKQLAAQTPKEPASSPARSTHVDYSDLDYKTMDFAYNNRYEGSNMTGIINSVGINNTMNLNMHGAPLSQLQTQPNQSATHQINQPQHPLPLPPPTSNSISPVNTSGLYTPSYSHPPSMQVPSNIAPPNPSLPPSTSPYPASPSATTYSANANANANASLSVGYGQITSSATSYPTSSPPAVATPASYGMGHMNRPPPTF